MQKYEAYNCILRKSSMKKIVTANSYTVNSDKKFETHRSNYLLRLF